MSEEINIKFYDPEVDKLRKENQQLKEENIITKGHHIEMVNYAYDLMLQKDKYKSVLDEIREYIKEQIDYLTKIDGQNIPLNDKFQFCSMNELYQTGKYSGFKEVQEKIEQILDKVKE